MQKKLLAVAVAGALIAPSAFAQTSVTISGAMNLWYESAAATGATAGAGFDAKSRDRIVDGAGSNIRFTVVEDIGGGMQAFGQVESATFNNADTRANAAGAAGATTGSWANRNSGIGLRSSAWGEILMGIWDLHYHEHYAADSHIIRGTSNSNTLGLTGSFGTPGAVAGANVAIGTRYGNVIRYSSPSWSGFSFRVGYARPTDGVPVNVAGSPQDNKKNRVWNFALSYSAGPIFAGYTHLRDKDLNVTATPTFWGTAVGAATSIMDVRSDRFMGAYTFPFGLKLGLIYDRSKLNINAATAAGAAEIKRDVWAFPVAYTAGAHQVHFQYSRARDWKGNIGGTDMGANNVTPVVGGATYNAGGDTGARMISLGYQYDLSKRTNLHLTYSQIKNEALAGYDFFSTPVGIVAGTGFGADPRVYSIGLRHAF